MPYRGDLFLKGCYYHIYNRTIGEAKLFFNPGNYPYCMHLIKRYAPRYGAAVIAYCLMPNHYHFLLRQETDVPLSRFVSVLFNAYVQAVNRQQGRKGTLFEGRFRHVLVEEEGYIIQLCRYIHLNPVKAGLVADPAAWPYSDYLEWLNERTGDLKDEGFIRERFSTPDEYRAFVREGMEIGQLGQGIAKYGWD